MTATSAQFAAKDALVTLLDAEIDGIDVTFGYPREPKREGIHVGNIEGEQEPYALGRTMPREEEFTIELAAAAAGRSNQREITRRAYEIAALVEAVLVADETLGGVVRYAAISSSKLREGVTGDKGRYAYIDYRIDVRTTLRV